MTFHSELLEYRHMIDILIPLARHLMLESSVGAVLFAVCLITLLRD